MDIKNTTLSKSTFMYGCQCPKRLFLHTYKGDVRNPIEEQEQAIFSLGTSIGQLAQNLFPNGTKATIADTFSRHESVNRTRELIAQGVEVIYEAAFSHENMFCAVDILEKKEGKWYAYEVKASTKVKDQFIIDTALQYYVINESGIAVEDIFIIYIDNQYIRKSEIDFTKLFKKDSVIHSVKENQVFIDKKIVELKGILKNNDEPLMQVGKHCYKPYECNFTNHCGKDIQKEKKDTETPIQINTAAVREFITNLKYPLFYFDFETIMPAVPEFDNSRPFQQIPFQYSLHIQREKGRPLEHKAFLGDGISDPRILLIENLLNHLENCGSIIVWNQTFEISRLKEIAIDFPEYESAISTILERIVDLMLPFRKKYYVHPDFDNSYSIKKILPVLVPELTYSTLEVKDGGTASYVYANLRNFPLAKQLLLREQLLEYCHLDTAAMVKIVEKLTLI